MKVLSIGIAVALPVVAGCSQSVNQSSLPASGAAAIRSTAGLVRIRPDNCSAGDGGASPSGGLIKWKTCGGYKGRMTYGPGTTGGKFLIYPSTTNPGGVPVPPGETPVLFVQQVADAFNAGPITFTPPAVPPLSNRARILGVPLGFTYRLYAFNGATLLAGFPIPLGTPNPPGTLIFTSPPYSPLPVLPPVAPSTTISFELATP
ncbi:MAG TPA: hypothetical protein VHT92_05300 [Candidatus Cybelea sp.]|jgi:hypothetical protein|nr:hypothetical protein [Candidatus Cybelea sp.]